MSRRKARQGDAPARARHYLADWRSRFERWATDSNSPKATANIAELPLVPRLFAKRPDNPVVVADVLGYLSEDDAKRIAMQYRVARQLPLWAMSPKQVCRYAFGIELTPVPVSKPLSLKTFAKRVGEALGFGKRYETVRKAVAVKAISAKRGCRISRQFQWVYDYWVNGETVKDTVAALCGL